MTTTEGENFYLVFIHDDGAREDCNVNYSELVIAKSGEDAEKLGKELLNLDYTYTEFCNISHTCNNDGDTVCDACDAACAYAQLMIPKRVQ